MSARNNKKKFAFALFLALTIIAANSLEFIRITSATDSSFSIVWITDTQHSAAYYPSDFDIQCSWIVNYSAALNVKAVIHTGDIVDGITSPSDWANANHSMSLLLNANIPYCWDAGNHDQYGSTGFYGENYAAFNVNTTRKKPYWVSDFNNGRNTAIRLNVSGVSILIVNIEFYAEAPGIQWANSLLNNYSSSAAIVGTHAYLVPDCTYDVYWSPDFRAVLDAHPNVFLTLNGHYSHPTGNRTRVGNRNELVFDRQEEDALRGGASIRILAFDLAKNTINVTTYLPYENRYLTDPDSQFTLYNVLSPGIIPEFPPHVMLTILLAATMFSALALKKNSENRKSTIHLLATVGI